jgi:hypothetical protein
MRGRIKFDQFIQADVDLIIRSANFSPEQRCIFDELCSGRLTDSGIAAKLSLSESAFYSKKKVVVNKIIRILQS